MTPPQPIPLSGAAACSQCGVAVPSGALSCPACRALLHAAELKTLAAQAAAAEARGDVGGQLEAWRTALVLLPPASSQYGLIAQRIDRLSRGLDGAAPRASQGSPAAGGGSGTQLKAWGGAIGATALLIWKFKAVGVFVLTKGKLLLMGLSKGSTFLSMLAAIGAYWTIWGWKFALGFVLSIYVHEMGHVAALKRLGIPASAPMFIPFIGAVVRVKQHITSPREDARVGLAGPIWGTGAALACGAVWLATGERFWGALTHAGAMINLFNLMPFWPLDGGRAFHALNRRERWIAAGVVGGALLMTGEGLLVVIGILAVVQAFREAPHAEGDRTALLQFAGLTALLAAMMGVKVPLQP